MLVWIFFFPHKEMKDIEKAVQNTFKLEVVCPKSMFSAAYLSWQ